MTEKKYRLFILKNDQGRQINLPVPLWFCPTPETKITAIGITEMVRELEKDCYFEIPESR